jgi:serpin B
MTLTGLCRTLAPAVLLATACSDPNAPGASEKLDSLPRSLTVAEKNLISGSNAFAFDLLHEINESQRQENVFISPLSASMALGMTLNGAEGATFDAMRNTLRLGSASREEVNASYRTLIDLLRGIDNSTDFRIANSIWYEKTFPFNASFIGESQQFFDAKVTPLDFTDASSPGIINSWVNEATGRKISKIVEQIPQDQVMYLIDAIYFKGSWRSRFDKSETSNAPFHALDGSSNDVPMMTQRSSLRVSYGADYKAVDLPYGNAAWSMTVVLPDNGADINTFAESMTLDKWRSIESSLHEASIPLFLPRFKLEWKRNLNEPLTNLGMGIAFTGADFSRMSPAGKQLAIDEVIQKTFLDVNEDGTEAAAVTSVGMVAVSAPAPFRVDRPFLIAIRENLSGTILFIGKIVKL